MPTALSNSFNVTVEAQSPLFSELVGYGQSTTGGKNGTVVTVINTASSGSGSLANAIDNQSGPTWIVFSPGLTGTINLDSRLEPNSNLTIDGRGADITITDANSALIYINHVDNVILNNLKLVNDRGGDDGVGIVGYSGYKRYWIHRCSFGTAGDECIGLFRYYDEMTFSWCSFNNTKDTSGYEGKGLLIGGQDVYEFSSGDVYPALTSTLTGGETVIPITYGQEASTQFGVGQEIGIARNDGQTGHWSIISSVNQLTSTTSEVTIEDAVPAETFNSGNIVAISRHRDKNIDPAAGNHLRYIGQPGYTPSTVGYKTRATVHHCYFNTLQRQPRCRNGIMHVYNNMQIGWKFGQSVRAGQASQVYYENCVADGSQSSTKNAADWFTADDPVITRGQLKSVGTHRLLNGAYVNERLSHRPEKPMFNPNDDYTYTADVANAALQATLENDTGWQSPAQVSHPGTTAPWDN